MIKECIVELNNDVVTVVRFGDIKIQFPSIHDNSKKKVFVESDENGRYRIVEYKKSTRVKRKEIKVDEEKPKIDD